ncbi:MAG: YmdB family metallophosphoesterase, partial [Deltaproteobacteria bacterium]|nr:YmdB family metallophosphoesterase [Deltaproteobacteria bacterium]
MTRVLFLGDVFAGTGRLLVSRRLPGLMADEGLDLALANAENAAGGVGLTPGCARELLDAGLDGLSGGNHTFRHQEVVPLLEADPRVIRPANLPEPCPGRGFTILEARDGRKVGFGNLMGRVYNSQPLDCPFRRAETLIGEMREAGALVTIIDFHAETTSEKISLAHFLDGRLGALLGTHTHVQTSDARILPNGLAFLTDAGMTGPHGSVIGMRPAEVISSFLTGRLHR